MSDFEPQDWLTERLRALGTQPVDAATQSQHLTAMAEAATAPSLLGTLGNRIRIAAAVGVGVLLGATGLASAGALGPLQPIASRAVEAATPLEVPSGKDDPATAKANDNAQVAAAANQKDDGAANQKDDADVNQKDDGADQANGVARVSEGCEPGISTANRGQYLKGIREKFGENSPQMATAKASRCGMPANANATTGTDNQKDDGDVNEKDDNAANHKDDSAANDKNDGTPSGESNGKSATAPGKSGDAPGAANHDNNGAANGNGTHGNTDSGS